MGERRNTSVGVGGGSVCCTRPKLWIQIPVPPCKVMHDHRHPGPQPCRKQRQEDGLGSLAKDLVSKESSRETDKAGHPVSPFML